MMDAWVAWLIAAVVLVIVEMVTPTAFFFACFGLGSLVGAAAAYMGLSQTVQWSAFFVSTVIILLLARPVVKKYMNSAKRPSNVDELIGKEAIVTETIAAHKSGMVKVKGEVWKAESSDEIAAGESRGCQRDGTHLIVKRKV